jgi:hypothetical protein
MKAVRRALGPERRTSIASALRAQRRIVADLNKPKGQRKKAAVAAARSAEHDRQIEEIHPAAVLAERARQVREGGRAAPAPLEPRRGPDNIRPVRAPRVISLDSDD